MFSDLKLFVYLGSFCLTIMGTGKLQQTTPYASQSLNWLILFAILFPFFFLLFLQIHLLPDRQHHLSCFKTIKYQLCHRSGIAPTRSEQGKTSTLLARTYVHPICICIVAPWHKLYTYVFTLVAV